MRRYGQFCKHKHGKPNQHLAKLVEAWLSKLRVPGSVGTFFCNKTGCQMIAPKFFDLVCSSLEGLERFSGIIFISAC